MARVLKPLSAVVLACSALLSVGTPAGAAAPAPEIIPIDLLLANSYTDAAREAIEIWNKAVPTIKFVEQDTPAALRVMEYKTAQGVQSHVYIEGAGQGWVYLEVGDAQLYKPSRIVVHELGHMLSLNDSGPGPCSKVMTGASAGADCPNDQPDTAEVAAVADFFAKNDVGDRIPWWGSRSAAR
ncbi:snapalysin family zinc-dependent metalloprotease [Streptomyces sp. NBC_00878]|uniref:snapalysin family zinc-dependent metalloprotease n=1 Tax=Streptomyces sp. NBC_00878 TaxID=2975854 RepID=UPI0022550FD0|nr:snapalysin family zinc-dependent metalloprotease [Streptomyces sp. NBC_00878]MCX4909985.1 snapalysin family zinc-dependent metalloprotease [Streptomyces sp. NBC_00878]